MELSLLKKFFKCRNRVVGIGVFIPTQGNGGAVPQDLVGDGIDITSGDSVRVESLKV